MTTTPVKAATYLVGGAVRDELLGIPVTERDWVVTGTTPEALGEQGFRQVGASFPVFLHPTTNEEYALARTERKAGHGYHGFTVDFHPGVTLEEDLARRDLTINAMAKTEDGQLIDPFGGAADLQSRVLRHVSAAFSEDPLRVLRVARFAARLAHLGFEIAPETMALMQGISSSGELSHLAAERSWAELEGGLNARTPSVFLQVLRDCGALVVVLPEVDALFVRPIPGKPRHHAAQRTQAALDYAAERGWSAEVRFAILLHAVGHDDEAFPDLPLIQAICGRLRAPNVFQDLALSVFALHHSCDDALHLTPAGQLGLLEAADVLRRPERFEALVQACEAIHAANAPHVPYPQAEALRTALSAAGSVRASKLDLSGLKGEQIGQALREARVAAIAALGARGGDADPAN